MSLTRQFLREFRPLFRMLEEPFGRQYPAASVFPRFSNNVFNDPFFQQGPSVPAIDLSEEGNQYIVEAELPGVKKENIEIRVGDNGQSITIEGKTFSRSGPSEASSEQAVNATGQPTEGQPSSSDSTVVAQTNENATQLSTERAFTRSSSFSRTIWLPQRVDSSAVSAKLTDGILTLRIPKAEDTESVKVNIE